MKKPISKALQKIMARPDAVSYLRSEAYFAYLDNRVKRAKYLNSLADRKAKTDHREETKVRAAG